MLPLFLNNGCSHNKHKTIKMILFENPINKQQRFFNAYADDIILSCKDIGLFPSVKAAQMACETGYGDSIRTAANNCFGIKAGKSWLGRVVSNTTRETINGKSILYKGTGLTYNSYSDAIRVGVNYVTLFRVYNSISESIIDHSQLLKRDRFKPVMDAKTPEEQTAQLELCGYATAHNYNETLNWIIKKFQLKKLDEKI